MVELVQLKLGRNLSISELSRIQKMFFRMLRSELESDKSNFKEIPGANSFFNALGSRLNIKIGIASGGWEESAKLKLDAIGIDPSEFCFSNSSYFKSGEEITRDVIKR